mgnify:CR=1 FL=1
MPISTPNHIPEIPGVLEDLAQRLEPVVKPKDFFLIQRPNAEGRPVGRGEIYLSLEGIRYLPPQTLEDARQQATVTIQILVRYFDPRAQTSAYEVMSLIRKTLVGYRLPNCSPMWIDQKFYSGGPDETGAHEYRQLFQFKSTFFPFYAGG